MNILFEEFPDSVCVNGENYQIETDFREWIRFIQLVEDDEVPWQIKPVDDAMVYRWNAR